MTGRCDDCCADGATQYDIEYLKPSPEPIATWGISTVVKGRWLCPKHLAVRQQTIGQNVVLPAVPAPIAAPSPAQTPPVANNTAA
jgi:hypothetical protein